MAKVAQGAPIARRSQLGSDRSVEGGIRRRSSHLHAFVGRNQSFLVFGLILVAVLILNLPALRATFLLDDWLWIRPLTLDEIGRLFVGTWGHGNTLRPVMRLAFLLNRSIFGEWPWGWHLMSVVLHALVAWTGYRIARDVTGKSLAPAVGALGFAIFPTLHENVAWISGQTHPVGLLLSLASSVLLYRSFVAGRHGWATIASGYVLMLAAFLTYEVSFVTPLLLVLLALRVGPTNRRSLSIAMGGFVLLSALIVYRMSVLGGTMGVLAATHTSIPRAVVRTAAGLWQVYWHATELKILLLALFVLLVGLTVRRGVWQRGNEPMRWCVVFAIMIAVAYAPFTTIDSVAPRFLYTSLYFCALTLVVLFTQVSPSLSRAQRWMLVAAVGIILGASAVRTRRVASLYGQVGATATLITQTVTADFPRWPAGKDMLFYGVPNEYRGILAFTTYFDRTVQYAYSPQPVGRVYRAQELSADELAAVLATHPVIYRLDGFGVGVKRVEDVRP
jgi:hypothetical protein